MVTTDVCLALLFVKALILKEELQQPIGIEKDQNDAANILNHSSRLSFSGKMELKAIAA